MTGLRGMFGGSIVFKSLRGKTVVAASPARPARQSEKQKANRGKFKDASAWAKTILLDAEKKAYYKQKAKKLKLPNAYTAAITDYMRKATVSKSPSRDAVHYSVGKRHFSLKDVAVVFGTPDGNITRPADVNSYDTEWHFKLSKDEGAGDVYIRITDEADQVMLIPLASF